MATGFTEFVLVLGTVLHLQGKEAARKYATSLQAFVLLNVPTGGE